MMDQWMRVNNILLHYLDHSGSGPPLILMPGLTANAHSFDGLINAGLSPALRVLALDLRGRGLSDKPDSGYSMSDHAADVLGLLDALKLQQVVLGGHSFGGLLTLYMAAHYPERVSKLVVIDAAGKMHPELREMIKPSIDRLGKVVPSWDAYLESMKKMPFFKGWWDTTIESYYRADVEIRNDGTVKPLAARSDHRSSGKSLNEDWAQHLAAIRQPMLLLNALGSFGSPGSPPLLPCEQALETVNAVALGRYIEVPGNHMTMLYGKGAQRMVAEIIAFVNQ